MEDQRNMLSRVRLMAEGNPAWDLSDNDIEALKYVLGEAAKYRESTAERDQLRAEVERLRVDRDVAQRNWDLTQKRATKWAHESTSATVRAEAAEAHVAGLRRALESNAMFLQAVKHVVADPIYIDSHGGWSVTHPSDGEVEYSVSLELRSIRTELDRTPAQSLAKCKAEALREFAASYRAYLMSMLQTSECDEAFTRGQIAAMDKLATEADRLETTNATTNT